MNAYSKSFSPIHDGITIPPLSLLVTLVLLLLPQMLWAGESLAFFQVDFNLGGSVYTDTDWGCVHFTFIGQEPIMYFNLAINDTWQVQNIPVLSIEGPGVEQTIIYYFALTTPSGVEVNNLNYGYAFTTDVQTSRPTTFTPALVEDKLIALWPGFGDNVAPPVESAQPLIGGEVAIAETMLSSLVSSSPTKHCHKNFPNQQCGKNECCPTAISNSLKFLNNRHKNLNMPDSMTSIDAMKNATNWRNGCSLFLWQFDKKEYMKDDENFSFLLIF